MRAYTRRQYFLALLTSATLSLALFVSALIVFSLQADPYAEAAPANSRLLAVAPLEIGSGQAPVSSEPARSGGSRLVAEAEPEPSNRSKAALGRPVGDREQGSAPTDKPDSPNPIPAPAPQPDQSPGQSNSGQKQDNNSDNSGEDTPTDISRVPPLPLPTPPGGSAGQTVKDVVDQAVNQTTNGVSSTVDQVDQGLGQTTPGVNGIVNQVTAGLLK